MELKFFINNRFEEHFKGEREVDMRSFEALHPHAQKWVKVLKENLHKLDLLDGVFNLVYNIEDHSVPPRNFDQADTIFLLNAEVNRT
ncbi:hypothetical protein HGH93_31215 [Chitinophaga polysaccharea]|uniref:hypothetical protein n=1 Tax=Chitinophaga TaxID=79328 RepID=UPI001455C87F|nr:MULTISPECIES: hypothetical protein [Chitinophaga]NLR62602.1 hypothetical protein [Chitinophaga polysaccharea]NLU91464.1 hypothetical protein [Chitinophaga sp. Ak27]